MKKLIFVLTALTTMTAAAQCETRVALATTVKPVGRIVMAKKPTMVGLLSVHRQSADVYVALGEEGVIRTRGCTVTSRGLGAILETNTPDGKPTLTFLDADGAEEGTCIVDVGQPRRVVKAEPKAKIHRQLAVAR